jgi:hypothetical protein
LAEATFFMAEGREDLGESLAWHCVIAHDDDACGRHFLLGASSLYLSSLRRSGLLVKTKNWRQRRLWRRFLFGGVAFGVPKGGCLREEI